MGSASTCTTATSSKFRIAINQWVEQKLDRNQSTHLRPKFLLKVAQNPYGAWWPGVHDLYGELVDSLFIDSNIHT